MASRTILNISLKELLQLFKPKDNITLIELGDTLHPGHGYLDQSDFSSVKTVGNFLQFDYDFPGLIIFKAKIGNIDVEYYNEKFTLSGDEGEIKKIHRKQLS